jgi:hypothetical protein
MASGAVSKCARRSPSFPNWRRRAATVLSPAVPFGSSPSRGCPGLPRGLSSTPCATPVHSTPGSDTATADSSRNRPAPAECRTFLYLDAANCVGLCRMSARALLRVQPERLPEPLRRGTIALRPSRRTSAACYYECARSDLGEARPSARALSAHSLAALTLGGRAPPALMLGARLIARRGWPVRR